MKKIHYLIISITMILFLTSCMKTPILEPVVSPAGKTYSEPQVVAVSCKTAGTEIRYTLDGSEPTKNSNLYKDPLTVDYSLTLKCKAYKSSGEYSPTRTETYEITKVQLPQIKPYGGKFASPQTVKITSATSDAEIRYTLDGSEPTKNSNLYKEEIQVAKSLTIKAKAFKTGWTDSSSVKETYMIMEKIPTPEANIKSGSFLVSQTISIQCKLYGAEIRYTLDGSEPTKTSLLYTVPITLSSSRKLKARAFKNDYLDSDIISEEYYIKEKVPAPVLSVSGGLYPQAFDLVISCPVPNVKIYYTTDGTIPTKAAKLYTDKINISKSMVIRAACFKDNWIESDSVQEIYNVASISAKCSGGSDWDSSFDAAAVKDGGFIVAGSTLSYNGDVIKNHGSYDIWIIKYNSSGTVEWKKCFGGTNNDCASSIIETAEGNFLIIGDSESKNGDLKNNKGYRDAWLLMIDSTGNILWSANYGGSDDDSAKKAIEISDGFIIIGDSNSYDGDLPKNYGLKDGWIFKIDKQGNLLWSKTFGGNSNDYFNSICINGADGSYIVSGETYSQKGYDIPENKGVSDAWIIKISNTGYKMDSKTFGGSKRDSFKSITNSLSGGFIVTGFSESYDEDIPNNIGSANSIIVDLSYSLTKKWIKCYGGSKREELNSIIRTWDKYYLAVGTSTSTDGDFTQNKGESDVYLLKTDQAGKKIWQKTIGGSGIENAFSIIETSGKDNIIAGDSSSNDYDIQSNKGDSDLLIITIDNY